MNYQFSIKKGIFLTILILAFIGWPKLTFSQTDSALLLQQQQTQLQAQLKEIEQQISQYEKELTTISSQKNTLANKIKQLTAQRNKINAQIKETTVRLQQVQGQISDTQKQIDQNTAELAKFKAELTSAVRELYYLDQHSLLEILLTTDNFSDFYDQVLAYQGLSQGLNQILAEVKNTKNNLLKQQQDLTDQEQQQKNFLDIINLQQGQVAQNISSQNTLLKETKGKEANYQKSLAESKKKADEIRTRIYTLFGTTQQVNFGQAVQIATWVSGQTGVRAAFLLAILTQESNLGKNVGTCNRAGDPPEKSWKVIMKPSRDQEPFKQITKELGLNIDTTPVSCPMKDKNGNQIGWGGAMGPAQFIPSTWMGYRAKVTALTGKAANPWDIRDAFITAAIKLKADGGATKSGEWKAAMKYFSGSTNPAYSFYGDNVVALANQYQEDIDVLNQQ